MTKQAKSKCKKAIHFMRQFKQQIKKLDKTNYTVKFDNCENYLQIDNLLENN